jgi:hypothetical protein
VNEIGMQVYDRIFVTFLPSGCLLRLVYQEIVLQVDVPPREPSGIAETNASEVAHHNKTSPFFISNRQYIPDLVDGEREALVGRFVKQFMDSLRSALVALRC